MTEEIEQIGLSALRKAYNVIFSLGESGKNKVRNNIHGEISLLADIEAEKAVLDTLKEYNLPIRIISEEHDIINLSNNPKFLGILDGLDGTKEYETKGPNGRYGTMFGIFNGINPNYSDYIFSGIIEHPTRKLFYAVKNKGAFIIENNSKNKIKTSNKKELSKETIIYYHKDAEKKFNVDNSYRKLLSEFKKFNFTDMYAAQTKYIDIASGKADLALEFTRKRNLEIAVGFGLIKEAGGSTLDINGRDLGQNRYFKFGYNKEDHKTLLVAATKELALSIINRQYK